MIPAIIRSLNGFIPVLIPTSFFTVKLPAYKAVHQKRIFFINDNSVCIPPLWQRGVRGDFLEIYFVKSPLIPLFQRGRLKGELFIPVYKTGYSSSFHHKSIIESKSNGIITIGSPVIYL
jgi:hypothetical protein